MNVADPAKVALAFTNKLSALLLPMFALPSALNGLPAAMLTAALAVTGAVLVKVVADWKVGTALTVSS